MKALLTKLADTEIKHVSTLELEDLLLEATIAKNGKISKHGFSSHYLATGNNLCFDEGTTEALYTGDKHRHL